MWLCLIAQLWLSSFSKCSFKDAIEMKIWGEAADTQGDCQRKTQQHASVYRSQCAMEQKDARPDLVWNSTSAANTLRYMFRHGWFRNSPSHQLSTLVSLWFIFFPLEITLPALPATSATRFLFLFPSAWCSDSQQCNFITRGIWSLVATTTVLKKKRKPEKKKKNRFELVSRVWFADHLSLGICVSD